MLRRSFFGVIAAFISGCCSVKVFPGKTIHNEEIPSHPVPDGNVIIELKRIAKDGRMNYKEYKEFTHEEQSIILSVYRDLMVKFNLLYDNSKNEQIVIHWSVQGRTIELFQRFEKYNVEDIKGLLLAQLEEEIPSRLGNCTVCYPGRKVIHTMNASNFN